MNNLGALEVLAELEQRGLHLQLRPDGNISAGPRQLLTGEISALITARKGDLVYALMMREDAETPDTVITPAQSLIETCRRLGIGLRLDADSRLVLGRSDLCGREPAIPLSLADAVEVHAEAIAALLDPAPSIARPKTSDECQDCGAPWSIKIPNQGAFCGDCFRKRRELQAETTGATDPDPQHAVVRAA